jgi:hypothetical protein
MRSLTPALVGAVLLSLQPLAAQAAPAAPVAVPLASAAGSGSMVEKTVFHCVVVNGVRRCRWVQGPPRPEWYTAGSPEWWRAMEDWGRAGAGRR